MTAVELNQAGLKTAKRALVKALPEVGSAHLTEALASACGFRTHAALQEAVSRQDASDPDIVLLDPLAFEKRLRELRPEVASTLRCRPRLLDTLDFPRGQGVLVTAPQTGIARPASVSLRARAWRNALVAGLNEGIAQRLFSVRPGDNRWSEINGERPRGVVFEFEIGARPALGYIADAGWDELMIQVAVWPTQEGRRWVGVGRAGFLAGELFASGWLERRDGAWLQSSRSPDVWCRKDRLHDAAAWRVIPAGYAEVGPFKL